MSTTETAAPANRAARRAAASNKGNRATVLNGLVTAIWQGVTAKDAAVAAYVAAGVEDEDTKAYVLRTYMARRLYPTATECTVAMLAEAQRVLALPGATSKSVEKRTQEQEKFCNGARQFLFGIRAAAGVKASDNRGGANNTGPRAPRTPEGEIPIAPPVTQVKAPKTFETGLDLRAHFYQVATTLDQMCEKYNSICDAKTRAVIARFKKDTAGWAPATPKA